MPKIHLYDCLASTNATAKELARAGAEDGEIVAARAQTAGRGQGDHTFCSPAGTGLYMSRIVRLNLPATQAVRITTTAAVALTRAIERVTGIQTDIKWINDTYKDGKKLAGILTESATDAQGRLMWAVIGIGVNLRPPEGGFPAEIADIAGTLYPTGDAPADLYETLLFAIAEELTAVLPTVANGAYIPEYLAKCRMGRETAEKMLRA